MGAVSLWEWLIVAVALFVLFGYRKLPEVTRSFGRALRVLRAESRGIRTADDTTAPTGLRRVIDGESAVRPADTPPQHGG